MLDLDLAKFWINILAELKIQICEHTLKRNHFTLKCAYQYYLQVQIENYMCKDTVIAVVEDNTGELQNYSLVTQQRKFFICSFEAVCSWCCKTRGG